MFFMGGRLRFQAFALFRVLDGRAFGHRVVISDILQQGGCALVGFSFFFFIWLSD